jgi:hypothetical protein
MQLQVPGLVAPQSHVPWLEQIVAAALLLVALLLVDAEPRGHGTLHDAALQ